MDEERIIEDRDIDALFYVIENMGWTVLMPEGGGPEDDGTVKGMVIGEEEFVKYVFKCMTE
jgi:hypothetical protein